MPADCAGMDMEHAPVTDESPSPLCLAHCEHAAQMQQNVAPDLPPVGLVALFELPRPEIGAAMHSGAVVPHPQLHLTEGSPPLRIQYQVFRI